MKTLWRGLKWVGTYLAPLLVCAWAIYAFFALRGHQDLPAHHVQETRFLEIVERVTRLEALNEALKNGHGGYGKRWRSDHMARWVALYAERNPGSVVPTVEEVLGE